jgi:hypothetical protein
MGVRMMQTAIALTIVFAAAAWLAWRFLAGRADSGPSCGGGGACSCGDTGKSTLARPKRHPGAGACSGCAAASPVARPR